MIARIEAVREIWMALMILNNINSRMSKANRKKNLQLEIEEVKMLLQKK